PATRPATPATRTARVSAPAAATPSTRLAVDTMPSLAPRTAARSQPIRPVLCLSACLMQTSRQNKKTQRPIASPPSGPIPLLLVIGPPHLQHLEVQEVSGQHRLPHEAPQGHEKREHAQQKAAHRHVRPLPVPGLSE